MKPLLIASALAVTLASPAVAQFYDSEIVDGVRILEPRDESRLNAMGQQMQRQAIEVGLFSWPVATEKGFIDPADQPKIVADCDGHDPEYRPAHGFRGEPDFEFKKIGQTKAFIHDWMAYGNALAEGDCTCASLRADWGTVNSIYRRLVEGIDNVRIQVSVPSEVHSLIQNDYNRMCDVRMTLDLE